MDKQNIEKCIKGVYIVLIVFFSIHNYLSEVNFQGYPNRFVAFFEMVLHDYVNMDYIPIFPLFHSSDLFIDSSLSEISQGILITYANFPFILYLHYILHHLTGLSPQILMKIPFGTIITPLIAIYMIRTYYDNKNMLYDNKIYGLICVYYIIYIMTSNSGTGFYVASICMPLILLLFTLIKKYFLSSYNKNILFIIFIISYSLIQYWTTAFMTIIIFIFSIFIVILINYIINYFRLKTLNINDDIILLKKIIYLLAICMPVTLIFIHLWQNSYVKYFYNSFNFITFIDSIITKLIGKNPFYMPYLWNYKSLPLGALYYGSKLLSYFICTLLIIIPILFNIINNTSYKKLSIKTYISFSISLIFAQIILILVYYPTRSIDFFYVPLFFPIIGLSTFSIIKKHYSKKLLYIFLVFLISLSTIQMFVYNTTNEAGRTSALKYINTVNNYLYLYKYMDYNKSVITDFNILHKYLQIESQITKPFIKYEYLTPEIYGIILGDYESERELYADYVIIDKTSMLQNLPIYTGGSRGQLLTPLLQTINNCQNQNKVFDDTNIIFLIFN